MINKLWKFQRSREIEIYGDKNNTKWTLNNDIRKVLGEGATTSN